MGTEPGRRKDVTGVTRPSGKIQGTAASVAGGLWFRGRLNQQPATSDRSTLTALVTHKPLRIGCLKNLSGR
ncbi:hypothetical protein ATPR_2022 [Acetobacter tropicalis NBRC 101654]|uniref:Uncharacterized protein n=1 Tax=Acetobacter tropicalis NBRC 101654 TaxID=749388 RepID=F7VF73_9PROT|nr:hypothetical protein ATPR_2022 [Acetobacter tropicalis NBRC 101654]